MARVFLLNPQTSEPVRTPLLSFAYLAAALTRAGHTVALYDASAVCADSSDAAVLARIQAFAPDLLGLHVKTLSCRDAWRLVPLLRAALGPEVRIVAGGPHVTGSPDEPFEQGVDFAVLGEGEETLCELADALDGARDFASILSLAWRTPATALSTSQVRHNAGRGFLPDLDALASPVDALPLFDPAWYGTAARISFGGILSSRGCPAACTFCCNNVTGRRFRYRSATGVAAEVKRLRDDHGGLAFTFYDDSFAVGRRRVAELADALCAVGSVPWSCTAHPSHLDPDVLADMRRAGCGGIDIGMESGDPERLKRIGKGVTVERVLEVCRQARDAGLHLVINLMFGWPGETGRELDTTFAFMERAADLGAMFNARGVLVPYPGTEIYDRHHTEYAFTRWWLQQAPVDYQPFPAAWDEAEILRAYAEDAALKHNFFRHDDAHLRRIQAGLDLKAQLTWDKVLRPRLGTGGVPAAGAR